MPTYDFDGKTVFVTGAARGQGRNHAVNYAKYGADVVVTDIGHNVDSIPFDLGTTEELEETADMVEEEGGEALSIQMDVREESEVESAVQQAIDEFGQVDILVNNAGIGGFVELVEMDEQTWDEMLDTNLKGVWLCSKHVGQHFVENGHGGKIVSTASIYGLVAGPGSGHYIAAKHGVLGLTKTLALELAEYDVNVNAICPTGVDTPMIEGSLEAYGEEPLAAATEMTGPWNVFEEGAMIESQDITEAYLWLSSDAARYVTGIALPVDAGMLAK